MILYEGKKDLHKLQFIIWIRISDNCINNNYYYFPNYVGCLESDEKTVISQLKLVVEIVFTLVKIFRLQTFRHVESLNVIKIRDNANSQIILSMLTQWNENEFLHIRNNLVCLLILSCLELFHSLCVKLLKILYMMIKTKLGIKKSDISTFKHFDNIQTF